MTALQFGLTPKMKPLPGNRSVLVAALDVGTSKIACLIGRLKPRQSQDGLRRRSHAIDVVGFGHTVARGMKAGGVVDLAEAEAAVRQCADLAERSAKMQLDSVVVSVSAGRPASELISASIEVAGSAIGESDIARVLTAGSQHSVRAGRAVLHSLPIGYVLDDAAGIRDPRGMLARRFGIDMHVVTTDVSVARNLMLAVERCHLDVEAMVTAGDIRSRIPVLAGRYWEWLVIGALFDAAKHPGDRRTIESNLVDLMLRILGLEDARIAALLERLRSSGGGRRTRSATAKA